ncbi:molybdopterin-dependent oxidoreductase [Streptomyces sp. SP18CS02]|uniref:molybdopterin-dependent oxidoreductase n=1 Tax=Streptomyces sp. SP18CS02 TaxID=3002531 RepID=UPI002E78C35E|nr:molybdopterin-dependent oxidoreductase [Streptomyces sp. SP18CS02]MEE1751579.1 molybdopterin-dependent oxidoreductase [Streptomyces sp. SP18CS02]
MTASAVPRGPAARVWVPETVTADPYNAQTAAGALAERLTPVGAFFVRDHFGIPRVAAHAWRLRLGGALSAPFAIGYDELLRLPRRELDIVVECAGNGRAMMTPRPPGLPWGRRAVGCARFAGVPFRTLAARAGVAPGAVEFVFAGADSGTVHGRRTVFARSLPVALALHPDTLLVTHMNGEPLSPEHGAPVRLVVPGRYAVADVKWLVEARAVTEPFTGVFQVEDYVYADSRGTPDGPVSTVRITSLIIAPEADEALRRGRETVVRGRAWSGGGVPVRRVEVRTESTERPGRAGDPDGDRGAEAQTSDPAPGAVPEAGERRWSDAVLEPPSGPYAWTGWSYRWTPRSPGPYRLLARATDEHGDVQPARAPWNARGYGCNPVATVEVVVV